MTELEQHRGHLSPILSYLVYEATQDRQVPGRIGSEDVSRGIDPRHGQDPVSVLHKGICTRDSLTEAVQSLEHRSLLFIFTVK